EWANRFAHVNAVRETCEANGKIASIEPGMGEWGLTVEDLEKSAQRTKDAVEALAGKTQCHVTTPLGTDFYVSIEGRPPLCGTPSEKGRIGTVHLALGDNHNAYPGGQNHCELHLDGVFLNATLQIVDDGTYILKDGEWAL